jgi:glycosyltransferase involved in cell wall biosynthesis
MKIGIDIRRAGGFGVGTYTRNLVQSLSRVGLGHQYVLVGSPDHLRSIGDLPDDFELQPYGRAHDDPRSHLGYGFVVRRLRLDVLHIPHRWVPLSAPRPYVATVHDLNNVLFPSDEESGLPGRLASSAVQKGLRRARRVIAVSHSTRQDAVKWLGLAEDRMRVVYGAVDGELTEPVTSAERQRVLERYSITDPFVLYAGRIQVHKNLARLIDAFAVVKSQLEKHPTLSGLKLIIIGDDISALPEVRHAVMRTRVQDSVRFLGFVPAETLRGFYVCSKAFLFPSLYEGFGMPPLEAMAHQTPVVTSNIPSLREAVGDAAELVNPENVFDIARGLQRVLVDDDYRAALKTRGLARVKTFSWDESARQVLDVYAEAVRR